MQDAAVTIKAELLSEPGTHLLIWTTTPWTLPANLAIAVGSDLDYVKVKQADDDQHYIVAEILAPQVFKNGFEVIKKLKGTDLIGLSYQRIYSGTDFARAIGDHLAKCFKVIHSGHVTTDSSTGLVHMAQAFGVDDFEACKREGIPHFDPIDEEGKFGSLVANVEGLSFKDADKIILKNLKDENKIFDRSTIMHSYPFCWRSNTPLMYKAVPVWFIDVPKIKERMSLHNSSIHWVPEAVGHKRFTHWLYEVLAPIVPFMSEMLYQDLVVGAGVHRALHDSVHLSDFPEADTKKMEKKLEEHVRLVRQVVNMGRALREKYRLKTRQPLLKITVVSHSDEAIKALESHQDLILSEPNVRTLELLSEDDSLCTLSCKPNFKTLGPRVGKEMNAMNKAISALSRTQLTKLKDGEILLLNGHHISIDDVVIVREAVADVVVMSKDHLTVALDTEINEALKHEGIMRDCVSALQRLRKSSGLVVSDRIKLFLYSSDDEIIAALLKHRDYLAAELLATDLIIANSAKKPDSVEALEIDDATLWVSMEKCT